MQDLFGFVGSRGGGGVWTTAYINFVSIARNLAVQSDSVISQNNCYA